MSSLPDCGSRKVGPRSGPTARCLAWVAFFLALLSGALAADEQERSLGAVDVARIRELYHLTDELGDQLWPGFDTRKIPIAINNHDREELLVGHPNPPPEFHPFADYELNGQPVMIRDGVTRYGPKSGGWATDVGGVESAYVGVLREGRDTETYLSLLLHECFHCYQQTYRERADGAGGEHPRADPVYSALINLEGLVLKAALDEADEARARELVRTFVAVRHQRRKDLPEAVILLEGEDEYNEGTASYVQVRMYQLLAARGGIKPVSKVEDPHYRGYAKAREMLDEELAMVAAWSPKRPTHFEKAMYEHGMAQCLLLDRLRPQWKEEIREKGTTQFALLERECPLKKREGKKLLAAAKKRFDYPTLLAEQERLVGEQLATIRGFIAGAGRHYRIYFRDLSGRVKKKSRGPLYFIPEVLEKELAVDKKARRRGNKNLGAPLLLYANGLPRFEMEGLEFESEQVPVIFGSEHLEWIDHDPAPDRSDMTVAAERREGDVYYGLKLVTRGFTLLAAKARIEWSKEVVDVHPLPVDPPPEP